MKLLYFQHCTFYQNLYMFTNTIIHFFWTKGNQGNSWNIASVNVPIGTSPYQIVFEGIKGTSYRGDIAIDDFSMTQGACLTEGMYICFQISILICYKKSLNTKGINRIHKSKKNKQHNGQ
jgi:hypothetical protein